MPSVLADAPFLQYALAYRVQSAEQTGTDRGGNPTYDDVDGTVTALLAPLTTLANPMLQLREGADTAGLLVKGELINPLAFPAGIGLGSELGVTYAGKVGVLTILSIMPNDLEGVDFGDAFEGENPGDVMPFDLDWKGDSIPDELDEPFYQANELLGRAFTRQITARTWEWPVKPTPRDIVDRDQLRDSYVAERGREGDDPLVDHAWTAAHSLPVHQGAVFDDGSAMPARPWTKKPLDDGVLEKAFEALVNAGVK